MVQKSKVAAVVWFLVFLATEVSTAQILNVEKSRIDKDSANTFFGNVSLNFNMFNRNSGNDKPSTFLGFAANSDLVYFSGKHSYYIIGNTNYVVLKRDPIVRTGYVHLRNNLYRRNRLSYEFFGQYQYDLGRRLDLRLLAGSGLRFAIHKSKEINLFVGSGLMLEHEEWDSPKPEEGILVVDLLKSSNYFSTRAHLNDNVEFNTITYYQVGYDQAISGFRQRLSGDINFLFKINNKLRFRTNFNCTYDNRPIVPVTKFIYSLTNGVQANF
ncbi:MAG: DUF481 domain-containing protein [Hymenobacteraceae bacterium]|nr:DUF481 domain-containing protein [Hymenobacteraceae bacterium]MDX5394768.1 DUF481 domain-containing protein [Hymenobacteraceae bacterium]MDX5442634.1 DUF481 domain-containing protein [Hymenobacteraceae bacterium]MDX5510799.1 DUF481 domain-containing protein [Hymenobacteraceae bacterium]